MAANNDAGKILLTPKGEYSGVTTYEVLDTVYYLSASVKGVYVAKGATTGNLPTDTDHWYLLVDLTDFTSSTTIATLSTLGLVKPDGITNEVSNLGVLTALGVAIDAEIDSTATAYGAAWLKVGTTTLTPNAKQLYRVTQNNREYLYYWNGTAYVKISGGGHIIVNASGTEFAERTKLKFIGASITDNAAQDQTEIMVSGGGGGGGSTITIDTTESSLYGESVTISDGTTTLSETFSNLGLAVFTGVTLTGTLTVTSTDGSNTATTTLSVPYFGNYAASLSFWHANINVFASSAALNGLTVYAKKNNQILGYATISNTSAVITVPEAGSYSIECTKDWKTYAATVSITEETAYSVTLTTFSATINLTTPTTEFEGQSIAVTVDGTAITGTQFDNNGEATYIALQAGTYVFTLTYNGEPYTATVVVSSETTYSAEIKMWTATIEVSTTAASWSGETVTLKKGSSTIGTTTFDNSGNASFIVHETGTYHVDVTDSGWTYSSADIVVSEETTYTTTINPFNATLSLSTTSTELMSSTITISKDGVTVGTTAFSSGSASYIVHETGTYICSVEYDGETYSETVVVSAESTYSITIDTITIYGVEWDGTSTTAWSRTDDAETFTDPVPAVGNGNGSSPFDNILPWSGMERVEDSAVGTLVKIPKYWYKWTRIGSTMKLQISASEQDDFFVSPAHADRGDGVGERDYVYVGAYHCATSTYKSTTGVKPATDATRSTFRTDIHNLGSTIWQYDYAMHWTIVMLYLVEFADWNSQAKIGYGCSDSGSVQKSGLCDAMTYHTGTNAANRTTYGHIRYRWIEDLWGNVCDLCDGIYFRSSDVYCIKNPSKFSDTTGGTKVSTRPTSSGYISAWSTPTASGFEYALYPSAVSGSSSTYICDFCEYGSSGVVLYVGGHSSQDQNRGAFALVGDHVASSKTGALGARLQKLP